MASEVVVGGEFFEKVITDKRVTPALATCLFCVVEHRPTGGVFRDTQHKIYLEWVTESVKQCPSCKVLYIVKDPVEESNVEPTVRV